MTTKKTRGLNVPDNYGDAGDRAKRRVNLITQINDGGYLSGLGRLLRLCVDCLGLSIGELNRVWQDHSQELSDISDDLEKMSDKYKIVKK